MAKQKTTESVQDLALRAIAALNAGATSTKAYQLGAHREHTWGIKIPSLAFQWMIGGSNIFPLQRYLSISGPPKSLKSTLGIEIGSWNVMDNGLSAIIDNESKSSASMFEAMTWWKLNEAQQANLIFKETESMEEWQTTVTNLVKFAREIGIRPKGERVPVFAMIDSLTGKSTQDEQEAVEKEGYAEGRGYPIKAMKITRFLDATQLTDTTMSIGYVRHMKQAIEATGHGPQNREGGGAAASFKASLSLRVSKGAGIALASHPNMPYPIPVEGYKLYMTSDMSCLGPDKRKIEVDILWQYVEQPDGSSRQLMKYDWEGALGWLLWAHKYEKGFCFKHDVDRLEKVIYFVQQGSKRIKCEALGLEDVTFSEFGKAIMANAELTERISKFLNITQYRSVQEVDLAA